MEGIWQCRDCIVPLGAVHKVCHALRGEGSEKVSQFVTGGGG